MNISGIVKDLTRAKGLHETILQGDKDFLYDEKMMIAVKNAKLFGIRGTEIFDKYVTIDQKKYENFLGIMNRFAMSDQKKEEQNGTDF